MKEITHVNKNEFEEITDVMLAWDGLAEEQKKKEFSKYFCTEFNIFLYMKDSEFFAFYVLPMIAHKLEKTLADRWMLSQPLDHYTSPSQIKNLNVFERVLVIEYLTRIGKESEA